MILYLDTSSLAKLYLAESHASDVRAWVDEAEIIATCRVAYPEMISALTRRFRAGDLAKSDYELLTETFTEDWEHFAVLDFNEIAAGRLARVHGLRGFDAVHLEAAKRLKADHSRIAVSFSSFDENLNRSAKVEKLIVLEPQ